MLTAFLMIMLILLYSFQFFFCKKYADSYPGDGELASPTFTVVSGVTVVFISLCFMRFEFSAQPLTWLLGALNALAIIGSNIFLVKCSRNGPFTIMQVFAVAGGIIGPTLTAWFGFGVELSLLKWLGVIAVIGGVYLASDKGKANGGAADMTFTPAFIPLCFCLALSNATYASLTDVQQRLTGEGEKEEMVLITYAVAATVSLIMLLARSRGSFAPFRQTRASLIFLAITSVCVGLAINLFVIIVPLLDDITLLQTFNNAGILLCSAILSFIFFGERFTRANIIGYCVMCGALVLVSVF